MSTTNTGINTGSGWMETFTGKSIPAQIVLSLVAALILFIVLFSVEGLLKLFNKYKNSKTFLVENTLMSNKPRVIRQNPADRTSKLLLPSDNELTGVEFTYSFFLYIEPSTIDSAATDEVPMKQVFYKGYSQPFPLMGPGVFIKGNTNTMRVMMNSYKNWLSYVDIDNIPLQKWFHVSLVFRRNNLEVYINGNMKGRIDMSDTYPYQNYQDVIIFGGTPYPSAGAEIRSFTNMNGQLEKYKVGGAIAGQISRLSHYRYALSFAEIQANVNEGPSTVVEQEGEYYYSPNTLKDTWWTAGQ